MKDLAADSKYHLSSEDISLQKLADDEENEVEEDISDIQKLDFSDMAITGTDWTIETITNQIAKGNIELNPSFQRRNAWNNKIKSRFIESLFLGLPIPQLILAEKKDRRGHFIVIDGKQRLLSLQQFFKPLENDAPLKIKNLEILYKLNGMCYDDIKSQYIYDDYITAFNNHTIRTVVIRKWTNVSELYLLFLRLNTGSVKLSPQELRQALYPGPFVNFVNQEASKNKNLRALLNINAPDFRMRDVEILTRYFAFYFFAKDYAGSMQKFLDTTCDRLNKDYDQRKADIKKALVKFNTAYDYAKNIFGKHAFRKYKGGKYEYRYNRAIIDIILFYFAQDISPKQIKENCVKIKNEFEELCSRDEKFITSLELSTKNSESVSYRFSQWGKTLASILNRDLDNPYKDR